jgi:hypothetical protein
MIRACGFAVPQPEFPSAPANPGGYHESKWVYAYHEGLLSRADVRYIAATDSAAITRCAAEAARPAVAAQLRVWLDQELDKTGRVVVKDPRLPFFTAAWLHAAAAVGADTVVCSIVRDPHEVIGSQDRYFKPPHDPSDRLTAWVLASVVAEWATRTVPRRYLAYKTLVDDPFRYSQVLSELLLVSDRQVGRALSLVDPSLHRVHRAGSPLAGSDAFGLAERVYAMLERFCAGDDPAARHEADLIRGDLGLSLGEQTTVGNGK